MGTAAKPFLDQIITIGLCICLLVASATLWITHNQRYDQLKRLAELKELEIQSQNVRNKTWQSIASTLKRRRDDFINHSHAPVSESE